MTRTPQTQPEPQPEPARVVRLARRTALIEDVAWMATTGETAPGAAARLRMRPGTLREALTRAGRPDLWRLLLANNDPAWRGYNGPTGAIRRDSTGRAA